MHPYQDPEFRELSTTDLSEIDRLVSQYESRRRRGDAIDIGLYLDGCNQNLRAMLESELVRVEAEILSDWGDLQALGALIHRWPHAKEWIDVDARPDTLSGDDLLTGNDGNQRFVIIRELAEGGIGQLYVARDLQLDREVAIKLLKRPHLKRSELLTRFEAEATVTSHLEHPNIIPVYARGHRACGQPYFAMRLIQGQSLKSLIAETYRNANERDSANGNHLNFRSHPAARDLLVRLITICRAVAYAHHRGWVHRDLKPSNIMVGPFGETVIIDWGLAAEIGDTDNASVGTAGYMSPEQSQVTLGTPRTNQPATDIYSLGCILYCMLTNRQPESASPSNESNAGSRYSTNRMISSGLVRTTGDMRHVPMELDAICRRATSIASQQRYPSADALANDLEAWLADEPTSVVKERTWQRLRRRMRSQPGATGATLGAVAATLAALILLLVITTRNNAQLKAANAREQDQTKLALSAMQKAEQHATLAEQAQQRLMDLLRTFLVDVEQELSKVPGSSSVRAQVLSTSLNQLSQIVAQFGDDQTSLENRAIAFVSVGDLFLRFGKQNLTLQLEVGDVVLTTPTSAAAYFFDEAKKSFEAARLSADAKDNRVVQRLQLSKCKAVQRRADVALMQGDIAMASALADESLQLAKTLYEPQSAQQLQSSGLPEALNWWAAVELCARTWKLTGKIAESVELLNSAIARLEPLLKQHPDNELLERSLGMAHVLLGDHAFQERDLVSASSHYEADLEISQRAYERHPDQLVPRRDLAVSLDRIGNIQQRQGKVEQSIETFLRSQSLRQALHDDDPLNQTQVRDLFVSHMKLGDAYMLIMQVEPAAAQYALANEIAEQMVGFDPSNKTARRFQSLCAEVMADVCIAREQLPEALRYAEQSLAASVAIYEFDRTNVESASDVLIGHLKVAKVYQAMKDWDKAIERLELAVKLADQQAMERTDSATDPAFTRLKLAEVLLLASKPAEARELCTGLVSRIDKIVQSSPQDSLWRRRQYQVYIQLGEAERMLDHIDLARAAYEAALKYAQAMIEAGQRVDAVRADAEAIEQTLSSL